MEESPIEETSRARAHAAPAIESLVEPEAGFEVQGMDDRRLSESSEDSMIIKGEDARPSGTAAETQIASRSPLSTTSSASDFQFAVAFNNNTTNKPRKRVSPKGDDTTKRHLGTNVSDKNADPWDECVLTKRVLPTHLPRGVSCSPGGEVPGLAVGSSPAGPGRWLRRPLSTPRAVVLLACIVACFLLLLLGFAM